MTVPVQAAPRQIVLEDGPQPYVTPEAIARRYRPANSEEPVEEARPARRPLARNPLVLLGLNGVLPAWSVRAGQEIARVYAVITSASAARVTSGYGERLDRGAGAEDLAPSLRAAYADRYVPWRAWAGAEAVKPNRSLAELTFLVCVEELGLWQVRQRVGLHDRVVKRSLQNSLHWYALNAGWVPEKNR